MEQNKDIILDDEVTKSLVAVVNNKNKHHKIHLKKVDKKNKFFIINIGFSSNRNKEPDSYKLFNYNDVISSNPIYITVMVPGNKPETHIIDPNKLGSHDYMSHLWNEKILKKYNFEKSIYYGDKSTHFFINYLFRYTNKKNYEKSIAFLDILNIEDYFNYKINKVKGPTILIGEVQDKFNSKDLLLISHILKNTKTNSLEIKIRGAVKLIKLNTSNHKKISKLFLSEDFKEKSNIEKIKEYANLHVRELNNILSWLQDAYLDLV